VFVIYSLFVVTSSIFAQASYSWLTSNSRARALRSFKYILLSFSSSSFSPFTSHLSVVVWKQSSGVSVLSRTLVHTILWCAAMHHNADVKTSLSPALSVRCDGALQIANSLTKCTLSTPRWKIHDNVYRTTEEKLQRGTGSPCLISPRKIYERGSTANFFALFFSQCIFLMHLFSWLSLCLCGKNPSIGCASSTRRSYRRFHRGAQWRSANRPFQPSSASRRMNPAAIFIIALRNTNRALCTRIVLNESFFLRKAYRWNDDDSQATCRVKNRLLWYDLRQRRTNVQMYINIQFITQFIKKFCNYFKNSR